MKSLMILRLAPRGSSSVLLRLAQAGVRLAQHVGQVLRAAGQAGAELGEDQAEALAVGAAHHVVDQVGRDRRGGLVDRDRVVRQLLLRAAGLAVDVVLADQRLLADVAATRRRGTTRSPAR